MKARNCFCAFIAACLVGASSHSQIRDGKYVFNNENYVTGFSSDIFTLVNLLDAKAVTSVMLQEIINQWAINLKSQVIIYEDIDALKAGILGGKIEIIVVTTPEYFMLRNQVHITPFLTYKIEDRTLDRMLLVSRIDSGIRSIQQLRKRKIAVFAISKAEIILPSLWLTVQIIKNGGNYRDDYAPWVYKVHKGTNAISDVFFRKADAAVVPEREFVISKELNPQIGAQLSVIDSSKQLLYSVLCYTDKMTALLSRYKDRNIQSAIDLLCNANTTEMGGHLLTIFRITGFVPFKNEYLKDTEALFRDFRTLSAGQSRRVNPGRH
jgi:ABC-type phosphate/phosphonate transport system substrate-binding protein